MISRRSDAQHIGTITSATKSESTPPRSQNSSTIVPRLSDHSGGNQGLVLQSRRCGLVTWNARALLHADKDLARTTIPDLENEIVLIQEFHGTVGEVERIIHLIRQTRRVWFSLSIERDTGGVLVCIGKKLAPANSTFEEVPSIPDKVLRMTVKNNLKALDVYNIHNLGFNVTERKRIFDDVRNRKRLAALSLSDHIIFAAGDLNFPAPGETLAQLIRPELAQKASGSPSFSSDAPRWSTLLKGLTELAQPACTRFGGLFSPTLSRIDRIYCSHPSWSLMMMEVQAGAMRAVSGRHWIPISDHTLVSSTLSSRSQMPKHLRTIPKWLAKHKSFKAKVEMNHSRGWPCASS
jgi:endonuclease/exonuclease/phosphatase family metal-dependent hydrolase